MPGRWILGGVLGLGVGWSVWAWGWLAIRRYQAGERLRGHDLSALVRAWREPPLSLRGWGGMALFTLLGAYSALHLSWSAALNVLIVTGGLALITLVDGVVRRIPNMFIGGLFGWALLQAVVWGRPALGPALVGVGLGGGLFLLIALVGRGAMGLGDVKLAATLGALLGYPFVLIGLLAGILLGGIAALLLLLTRRKGRKDYMAYGPYLAVGGWIIFLHLWHLI